MCQKLRNGLAICAVPEVLLNCEAVLLCQESPSLLVHVLQSRVHHAVHANDPGHAIVERCRLHHRGFDFVELGSTGKDWLQRILSS